MYIPQKSTTYHPFSIRLDVLTTHPMRVIYHTIAITFVRVLQPREIHYTLRFIQLQNYSLPKRLLITKKIIHFQLIEFFFDVKMDDRIYILALFPFVCLLSFIPNLKYLTPFSVVGALFMLIGISVTLYYLFEDLPDPARLEAFTQALPVPMYCNLFLYALHNVTLCLPLENSMKNPEHLPRLITCNILLNTCLCTMFGFLGYNKYMKNTCDTVIKNLPLEET